MNNSTLHESMSPSEAAKKDDSTQIAAKYPVDWPSPEEFLQLHKIPHSNDFDGMVDSDILELLVLSLFDDRYLKNFDVQLQDDSTLASKKVSPEDVMTWLSDLSELLKRKQIDLKDYLVNRHGEAYVLQEKRVKKIILNQSYIAEDFTIKRYINFDIKLKRYYRYDEGSGLWENISEEKVIESLADFLKQFADDFKDSNIRNQILVGRTRRSLGDLALFSNSYTHLGNKPKLHFIHTKNCMVNIKAKIPPKSFSPLFFSRNQIDINYKKGAYAAKFERNYLNGVVDASDAYLLQLWAGSALLGHNYFSKILLLTGTAGAGKSTFISIIENIIGSVNCCELRTATLDERFEISRFLDKTLLLGKDVADSFLDNKSAYKLKSLTGGDMLTCELKHKNEPIEIMGNFNVAITCNKELTLKVSEDADAWKRRLLHVEFKKLKPFKADRDFVKTIVRTEGSGILNWMLDGARQILHLKNQKAEFPLTSTQEERVDNLLEASDSIQSFVKRGIISARGKNLTSEEIYRGYTEFCDHCGMRSKPKRLVLQALVDLMPQIHNSHRQTDIRSKNGTNVRGYRNVALVKLE